MNTTNSMPFLAILRQFLTFGGGLLASKGYIGADDSELLVGGVVAIGSAVWSTVQSRKSAKAVAVIKEAGLDYKTK